MNINGKQLAASYLDDFCTTAPNGNNFLIDKLLIEMEPYKSD